MKIIMGALPWLFITALVITIEKPAAARETKGVGSDTAFISKNITENVMEISFAQLAEQKSTDIEIKKAAAQIMADHKEVLDDLKRIARKKNMVEPSEATANGPSSNMTVYPAFQSLDNLTGREFEKMWLSQMLVRQEAKIADLEKAAMRLSDAELKSIVNRALQKTKIHRDMLTRIKYKYPND